MLVGTIDTHLVDKSYPPVITNILKYLNKLDLQRLPLGRHEFDQYQSDKAWFVVLEYEKQPISEFYPEVHKYHSDLQIVLTGSEIMAWSIDNGMYMNSEPYNTTRDLQFYKKDGIKLNYLEATPGNFYLFTPNIVHVTNIQDGNTSQVRKLVVKIHNDLLVQK